MKRKISVLLLVAAAVEMLAGCGGSQQSNVTIVELQEAAMEAEQTVSVVRGDIEVATDLEAWVGPKIEQLSFEKDGNFGEYKVQLGDTVQKGDVLATLNVENLQDDIKEKTEEFNNLTVDYEYHKNTLENQIAIAKLHLDSIYEQLDSAQYGTAEYTKLCVSAGEYDEQRKRLELQKEQLARTYELEWSHCKAQLEKLKEKNRDNEIKAPFDGVVVALEKIGYQEAIDKKKYYVALADLSVMYARCEAVSVSAVNNMEKIVFLKDDKTYETTFVLRDAKFYQEMRGRSEDNFTEFEIAPPQREVQFGDYGYIHMVSKHKEDVLLLPENAVTTVAGSSFVYKQVDGKKQQVAVEIGYKDGIMVEIVSGLEEGDMVYVQKM